MQNQNNFLTPESIQTFLTTLGGLDKTEISKAKELYIRNSITEFIAQKKQYEAVLTSTSIIHKE